MKYIREEVDQTADNMSWASSLDFPSESSSRNIYKGALRQTNPSDSKSRLKHNQEYG